jgi:hypothetical protein
MLPKHYSQNFTFDFSGLPNSSSSFSHDLPKPPAHLLPDEPVNPV